MSKKRKASEAYGNEETTEDSDPVSQQGNNAKRAKLVSLSDTTLQDLPIEMLECILVKVVAMEVKSMKMAKSVWKEKADLVIDRLRTVCSQWSSICATNFFRNEIHRILDGTAQETFRLEILHQSPIEFIVRGVTILKDEIFMLCLDDQNDFVVNVFDRNNVKDVKDVIPLPEILDEWGIVSSPLSCCVYVGTKESHCHSVIRIERDDEQQYTSARFLTDLMLALPTLSGCGNGRLAVASRGLDRDRNVITVYDENGSLQHEVMMPDRIGFIQCMMNRANGDIVLVTMKAQNRIRVTEFDMVRGMMKRDYLSSRKMDIVGMFTDVSDRILVTNFLNMVFLCDRDLNSLYSVRPCLHDRDSVFPCRVHHDRDRNELFHISFLRGDSHSTLTIFRLTDN